MNAACSAVNVPAGSQLRFHVRNNQPSGQQNDAASEEEGEGEEEDSIDINVLDIISSEALFGSVKEYFMSGDVDDLCMPMKGNSHAELFCSLPNEQQLTAASKKTQPWMRQCKHLLTEWAIRDNDGTGAPILAEHKDNAIAKSITVKDRSIEFVAKTTCIMFHVEQDVVMKYIRKRLSRMALAICPNPGTVPEKPTRAELAKVAKWKAKQGRSKELQDCFKKGVDHPAWAVVLNEDTMTSKDQHRVLIAAKAKAAQQQLKGSSSGSTAPPAAGAKDTTDKQYADMLLAEMGLASPPSRQLPGVSAAAIAAAAAGKRRRSDATGLEGDDEGMGRRSISQDSDKEEAEGEELEDSSQEEGSNAAADVDDGAAQADEDDGWEETPNNNKKKKTRTPKLSPAAPKRGQGKRGQGKEKPTRGGPPRPALKPRRGGRRGGTF